MESVMDARFPQRSKQLLDDLSAKRITQAEFQMEVSYWALMDGWDELRPKAYPTVKPEKVMHFEQRTLERGERFDPAYFRDYPEVLEYYDRFRRTHYYNKSTYEWILFVKEMIPAADTSRHETINKRINEFKAFFAATSGMVDIVKKLFNAREIKDADREQ